MDGEKSFIQYDRLDNILHSARFDVRDGSLQEQRILRAFRITTVWGMERDWVAVCKPADDVTAGSRKLAVARLDL
jgi:hypothetical protein